MKLRDFFYSILIIFLIILGLSLWVLSLNTPLYDDAGSMPVLGKYHDSLLTNVVLYPHGLINTLFFALGMKLFGVTTFGLRFTLFLITFVYTVVLFFFVRKAFSNTAAWYAVLLTLFTFFAFFNYLVVESDGIINSLFSLLIFSFLYTYLASRTEQHTPLWKKTVWLIFSLFSFGFIVAMKYRTGLLLLPLVLYLYYSLRNWTQTVLYALLYGLSAMCAIGFTLSAAYFTYGSFTDSLLGVIFTHNTVTFDLFYKLTHPSLFVTLVIALSPIYLFLPFLSFKRYKPQYFLCYSWISVCVVFLFLIPAGLSFVKYVAGFLLPPLTILSADILTLSRFKKAHHLLLIAGILLCSLSLIYMNNTLPTDYWYFLTEMGPVIKVWQPIIYFIFPFCFLLFLLLWQIWDKKVNLRQPVLLIFLILSFSFNILLIADNLVDKTHPQMIQEVINYAENHKQTIGRIYSWNEDIPFYLGNVGFYIVPESEQDFGTEFDDTPALRSYSRMTGMGEQGYIDLSFPLDRIKEHILTEGGTVFLLNYPYKYMVAHPPSDDLLKKIDFIDKTCVKELERTYKTATLLIYSCPAQGKRV